MGSILELFNKRNMNDKFTDWGNGSSKRITDYPDVDERERLLTKKWM